MNPNKNEQGLCELVLMKLTNDTSTRLLVEDELELVSGGRIAQAEGYDKSVDQEAAGFDPADLFDPDTWKGSV